MAAPGKRSKKGRHKKQASAPEHRSRTQDQRAREMIQFFPRAEPPRSHAPVGAGNVVMYPRAR